MSSATTCIKDNGLFVDFGWKWKTWDGIIEGLNDVTIEIELIEGKEQKNFSSELKFYGEYFEYLKDKLVDSNDKDARVYVEIKDKCCKDSNGNHYTLYTGYIYANAITYCDKLCSITANVIFKGIDDDLMNCMANTMIYDNANGFQNTIFPKVEYCLDYKPELLHYIMVSLGVTILALVPMLKIGLFSIDWIIVLVCKIPGVSCNDDLKDGIVDDFNSMVDYLLNWFIGCGKYHPAPFVKDYIQNVCDICGNRIMGSPVTFTSTILNDPASNYYDMVLFSALVEGGKDYELGGIWGSDTLYNWINEDRPILSGSQFLDNLAIVFNARWFVESGILRFERKDKFEQFNGNWINLENHEIIGDGKCVSWLDEDVPSYLNISYASDTVEIEGQSKIPNYSCIVEWNPTHNTTQKGERKVILPFGSSSFADGSDFFSPMRSGGVEGYLNLFGADKTPYDVLIMAEDTCQFDKLLIIDKESFLNGVLQDPEMEHVTIRTWPYNQELPESQTRQYGTFNDNSKREYVNPYNMPLQINPSFPGNLYTDFHFIDEPWNTTWKRKSVEVTILSDCDTIVNATTKKGAGIIVDGIAYNMQITKLEIKLKDKTIKFTGKI